MTNQPCVLIVDDNVDAAQALAFLFEEYGYSVSKAHSGEAALAAAMLLRPSVVILDLGMPGMSGFEVAIALRKLPVTASALLVAVSGHASQSDREKSRAAGIDMHFAKPTAFAELERSVSAFLRGGPG